MNIRRGEGKDIARISELLFQVNSIHRNGRPDLFKSGVKYNSTQLKEILADNSTPVFVAVDDNDEVMGYAFCIIQSHEADSNLTDVKTLYIDDLCVDEALRGQHIGTALLNYVFSYAKETGCYNVTLNVWSFNNDAYNFYTHSGMSPLKTYMEKIVK